MLTTLERLEIQRNLKDFEGLSYAEIAATLTEKFGREISRNTARYYLSSMRDYTGRAKGRPSGTTRDEDIWDQLLPELLSLTGISASRLYRDLMHLLTPEHLPFGESAFHERTGLRSPTRRTGKGKAGTTLLERCNLRIKVVKTYHNDAADRRVYLFGYEELTGYTAFDAIRPSRLTTQGISDFAKGIEEHLSLPVRRVCLIGKEFARLAGHRSFEKLDVQRLNEQHACNHLNSPYKRSEEIDLLQRLMKKQNDGTARAKAAIAKEALSHIVHQQILMGNSWKTPAQMALMRRLTAEAKELEPYLSKRYKMYRPTRRPR
jgi:hypothetical protein